MTGVLLYYFKWALNLSQKCLQNYWILVCMITSYKWHIRTYMGLEPTSPMPLHGALPIWANRLSIEQVLLSYSGRIIPRLWRMEPISLLHSIKLGKKNNSPSSRKNSSLFATFKLSTLIKFNVLTSSNCSAITETQIRRISSHALFCFGSGPLNPGHDQPCYVYL